MNIGHRDQAFNVRSQVSAVSFPRVTREFSARVSRRLRGSALQQKCHTVNLMSMTGGNFSNASPHGAAPITATVCTFIIMLFPRELR